MGERELERKKTRYIVCGYVSGCIHECLFVCVCVSASARVCMGVCACASTS